MKKTLLLASLLIVSTMVFSGCFLTDWASQKAGEQITEQILEAGTNSDIEVDYSSGEEGSFSVNTSEGSFEYGSTEIPSDLPSDIPVYDNAIVIWTSTSSADKTWWVDFETDSSIADVTSFYDDELAKEGWEVTNKSTYTSDGLETILYYTEKDDASLSVTVASNNEGKVNISVNYVGVTE
ncbi:MAG: hypothetical protein ABH835_00750 [Patescibacteria group bacterium]|nr:hypothetical protein [Patescibacteria group bacterium]